MAESTRKTDSSPATGLTTAERAHIILVFDTGDAPPGRRRPCTRNGANQMAAGRASQRITIAEVIPMN